MLTSRSLLFLVTILIGVTRGLGCYCTAQSDNCGQQCRLQSHCPGGRCQEDRVGCSETVAKDYAGKCNRGVKCGQPCNTDSDCTPPEGGQCWKEVTCGKCNYLSRYRCGQVCGVEADCSPGNCWGAISKYECDDILQFFCDANSGSLCGQQCKEEEESKCSAGGHCVTYHAQCGGKSGYCSLESENCGSSCSSDSDCSNGHCLEDKETCVSTVTIGTYTGTLPGGKSAPPLKAFPKEINMIMLSFAKDANHDGNFKPFSEWSRQGLTKENIAADKTRHPGRKYVVSLGGTAGYGGTFAIRPNMTTEQWVSNSVQSVSSLIESLAADGAEMQFENNTGDPRFKDAMTGLLKGLKEKGYTTSIGPYYGPYGTWHDFKQLPMEFVDYVNMQFYSMQDNNVEHVQYFIQAVQQELDNGRGKLVAGFNTNKSPPEPSVSLKTVYGLRSSLKGVFTWDIEHSTENTPPYCLETGLAAILEHGASPGDCTWS